MKLYWGPHTCAIGIHILLEEIGAPYETEKLDVAGGATHAPPFLAINPKGKVPVLVRDDGSVLTEFLAIAMWLARKFPAAKLLPEGEEAETRMLELMAYVEGTVHGQGFARMFLPKRFEPQDVVHGTLGVGQSAVKRQGQEMAEQGFAILEPHVAQGDYLGGRDFTIGDAALFYVERWAPQQGISLPVGLQAHYARMLSRPAVHRVMGIWGEL